MKKRHSILQAATAFLILSAGTAFGDDGQRGMDNQQGYAFTYQGQLNDGGDAADGSYDMRFSVFSSSGVQIHSPVTYLNVTVTDGLFNVDLDFDESLWTDFANTEKYLQVEVRTNSGGSYTALAPRTVLTSAPHANVAQRANALTFPYVQSIVDFASGETAFNLSVNEGRAMRLESVSSIDAILLVEGNNPYDHNFFDHTGLFNDRDSTLGLISVGNSYSLVGYNNSPVGQAAILAEVGFGASPSISAITAFGFSTTARLAHENFAGLFGGDVHVNNGSITQNFGFSPAPAGPIAYGFIELNGNIGNATGNMSCVWDDTNDRYVITLSGHTLSFGDTAAIVTVVDTSEPRVATTNVIGDELIVKIWDINSGNTAVQDNFQIAIFQANDLGINRSPVPSGMDPELYYQQTGTSKPTTPYNEPIEIPKKQSALQD